MIAEILGFDDENLKLSAVPTSLLRRWEILETIFESYRRSLQQRHYFRVVGLWLLLVANAFVGRAASFSRRTGSHQDLDTPVGLVV